MELSALLTIAITIAMGVVVAILLFFIPKKSSSNTPPGPKGIPILGNLLQLGDPFHQTMHNWRKDYGPIIWLKIGSVNTMVVQSAAAATELFKKHDLPFSGRMINDVLTVFDFHRGTMSFSDVDSHWRVLRRLSSKEMFVNRRINETAEMRQRIRNNLEGWLVDASDQSMAEGGNGAVRVGHYLFLMAFNSVGNLMFSRDLLNPKNPEASEFYECMNTVIHLPGKANVSDSLPWLKWLDPAGLRREMKKKMRVALSIVNNFILERIDQRRAGKVVTEEENYKDYLDVLLDYKGDGKDRITQNNINLHIAEMFLAGSETTSVTIEWGFAELLRSPRAFTKLRQELDRVVGLNRQVEETDIENLPYLQAVVKETLRLHPAVPFLLPRKATEDTTYLGYNIPKGTRVLVNVWSIARDSESWEDPLEFKPERFLDSNVEYKGQHFNFIPFGAGRRICPGLPWGQRVVPMAIGTLIHSFDWDLGVGVKPEDIDVEERLGLTCQKKNPLFVIPKRRLNI